MKHTKSKALTLLLTLAMLAGLLPWSALPARAEGEPGSFAELQALLDAGGTVTLDKDYAAGADESALNVTGTVTLDLNGHVIDRGLTSAVDDGCVIKVSGSLTLVDSSVGRTGTITGGRTRGYGGGVFVNGGAFVMNGGTVAGNTANNGGGVSVRENSTFVMNGGTITGNTANNDGGGVSVTGDKDAFTMNGGVISDNTAASWGGGVLATVSFAMSGGAVSGNIAGDEGGGVWIGSIFTLTGGVISGNTVRAGGDGGGGVYVSGSGGELEVSDSPSVFGNFMGDNEKTPNNVYLPEDNTITVTDRLGVGACIGVSMETPGTFTSGEEINNIAMASCFFSDDALCTVKCENSEAKLCAEPWSGTLPKDEGLYYVRLTAAREGGIDISSGQYVTLDLNGQEVTGGIRVNGGRLTLIDSVPDAVHEGKDAVGGTISENEADYGGVYVYGGKFIMCGGTISENKAISGNGGGVYVYGGGFVMNGGVISGNEADKGGGVYVTGGGMFTMNGGVISGNRASGSTGNGGGVLVNDESAFVMNGGVITGNRANYGGGVYANGRNFNSTFTMAGGSITGNNANTCGGVYVMGTFEVSGSPVISGNVNGGTFNEGVLTGGYPGNVRLGSGKFITVTDALGSGARIGVTVEAHKVFAKGGDGYTLAKTDAACFTRDGNDNCGPHLTAGGEVEFVEKVPYVYYTLDNNTPVAHSATYSDYTEVTASLSVWDEGWYVASGSVTIGEGVTMTGEVHLVLCDNATLTVEDGIDSADYDLTVYGQSGGSGSLSVTGRLWTAAFNMHGGTVTVSGSEDESDSPIKCTGDACIYHGTVEANLISDSGRMAVELNRSLGVRGGALRASTGQEIIGACAIWVSEALSVTGGEVMASGSEFGVMADSLSVAGGEAAVSGGVQGVQTNSVSVTGGTLTAEGNGEGGIFLFAEEGAALAFSLGSGLAVYCGENENALYVSDGEHLFAPDESFDMHSPQYVKLCAPIEDLFTMAAPDGKTYIFNEWDSETGLPAKAGNYYLANDVTLSTMWYVKPHSPIRLCLNGHGVTLSPSDGSGAQSVIYVQQYRTLEIFDTGEGEHKYSVSGGLATLSDSGDKSFTGGWITGGTDSGVHICQGGRLILHGGTILGNTASSYGGGGVFVGAGELTLDGAAAVTGNTLSDGRMASDVYLASGSANIVVAGELTGKPGCIGIDMETPGAFASGTKDYSLSDGDLTRFKSEKANYEVRKNSSGNAALLPIAYKISYSLGGGTNAEGNPAAYTVESKAITLEEPTRKGYEFLGWTYDGQTTPVKSVTIAAGSTGDKSFTAKWRKLEPGVAITGVSGDGKTVSYTVENAPEGAMLIAASYSGGRLVAVKTADVSASGTIKLSAGGTDYMLMLVDRTSFAPLCAAAVWPQ